MRQYITKFLIIFALSIVAPVLGAADEDQTLSVSPVAAVTVSSAVAGTETASTDTVALGSGIEAPRASMNASASATASTVLVSTPAVSRTAVRPRPVRTLVGRSTALVGIEVRRTALGLRLIVKANGPITGSAANLSAPERILVKISGVGRLAIARVKAVHVGEIRQVRFALKGPSEAWVVVDLAARMAFRTGQPTRNSFELLLVSASGAVPVPKERAAVSAVRSLAALPRINLMLFDLDVLYQGKEYKRFPCANFIYNPGDHFPLKRQFVSTLVFSRGYGAFVGNARIFDPEGRVLDQTDQPFAFNLFNSLSEFFFEKTWNVEFQEKGTYTLFVDLNGSDVLKQPFYVGQTTDVPPAH